jgi:hypothetical protein
MFEMTLTTVNCKRVKTNIMIKTSQQVFLPRQVEPLCPFLSFPTLWQECPSAVFQASVAENN